MLVSPPIQQHDDGVSLVLPTPIRRPCVVSAASECCSVQSTTALPPRDEALHHEKTDPPRQPRLPLATNTVQPSQSENCSAMFSNQFVQAHSINIGHGHMGEVVPRSDNELPSVARPASVKTPPSGCSHPVSHRGAVMEAIRKHQAPDDISPLGSCPSSSPTGQGRDDERQTSIDAGGTESQLDEPCEETEKRPTSRRGSGKPYNLRPLPPKRQLTAEQQDGGINEKLMPQRKHRRLVFRQPKKRNSQQRSDRRSDITRNRETRLLRSTTKSNDNESVANKKRPVRSGVASHEAWPLGQPVLRCTRENGTAMFQLHFTSDILWNTLVAQNDPAPKGHQTPNKLEDRRPKAGKVKYPSVCRDVYRVDCLLARWRRHTFLVKWSDATTTWEPRKHIMDEGMLNSFEASWRGFDAGLDVLKARQRAGRRQHLLRWHGRPSKCDSLPPLRTINTQSSALQLATACIQYLLLHDFQTDFFEPQSSLAQLPLDTSLCLIESPIGDVTGDFWDNEDLNFNSDVLYGETDALYSDICEALSSNFVFYSYAASYWAEHFAVCEEVASPDLKKGARSLLDVNTACCRNWLHFYQTRAVGLVDAESFEKDPVVVASQFNSNSVLNDLLGEYEPSQATKDRSLFWAARLGYDRIVTTLLLAGADPNSKELDRQTALTTASEHGNLACVVKLLADQQTNINMLGRGERSALSFACGGGHDDIVKELLKRPDCNDDEPDHSGATPFFWAVGGGHRSTVSNLSKRRSVNINHRDKQGRTAISWAAGDGMADILAILLKLPGIEANIPDNKGRSPLSWASGNGRMSTVEVLLENGTVGRASIDKDKRTAISWASAGGHYEVLVKLLDCGYPGVDTEDIDGWTPLAWAIQTDAPDTVQALIDSKQVQLERRDRGGRTALSWAVGYGHAKVVNVLLRAGADPDARSNDGRTPISIANQFGRSDMVKELMAHCRMPRRSTRSDN
ncbi:Ankyrin repeat protein [Metarhizium guizhouense ARSEF 977]|uniref:Ankyrin repeat protein n=1 Tax=Metarhizium guizhouense (strain ARSEF 977) TaxID=1276136 RepID=A0A0B4G4V4_METGA|nr:Ankyrin repeat protein [Metarhizium guizhouense ARSEF 977]